MWESMFSPQSGLEACQARLDPILRTPLGALSPVLVEGKCDWRMESCEGSASGCCVHVVCVWSIARWFHAMAKESVLDAMKLALFCHLSIIREKCSTACRDGLQFQPNVPLSALLQRSMTVIPDHTSFEHALGDVKGKVHSEIISSDMKDFFP